jgi:pilus assembly protein CpaB
MRFTRGAAARHLAVRSVPERFVPPSALATVEDAVGHRVAGALQPGDYLTGALLRRVPARQAGPGGEGGSRLVEVEVAGASTIAPLLRPGSRVDVLITTQGARGSPRTYLAMQDVGLAGFSARDAGTDAPDVSGIASLRVSLREAVLLTAAQSFARELRLVPRPAGTPAVPRLQIRERDL